MHTGMFRIKENPYDFMECTSPLSVRSFEGQSKIRRLLRGVCFFGEKYQSFQQFRTRSTMRLSGGSKIREGR